MIKHRKKRRTNYAEQGHAYELTFSCYKGFKFLQADRTRHWLAQSIEHARRECQFDLWAFVFMPEHVHLIIRPHAADVSTIRQHIKSPVARQAIQFLATDAPEWIPRITRKRGDRNERVFWQSGGGYDRNITEPKTLARMIDYVHQNPVRRGLVELPEQWRWSSAAWYAGVEHLSLVPDVVPPEWLVGPA